MTPALLKDRGTDLLNVACALLILIRQSGFWPLRLPLCLSVNSSGASLRILYSLFLQRPDHTSIPWPQQFQTRLIVGQPGVPNSLRKLENKTIFRYGLIGLSVLLGLVVRTGYLDSYEVPYIAAIQQAALNAHIMWFFLA